MNRASRSVFVAMVFVLALAFAEAAFAATFTNQYPAGAVRSQPQILSVTVFSSTALDSRTARIRVDGVAYATRVRVGVAGGRWETEEIWNATLGVWQARWTWVPMATDASMSTLYAYPAFSAPLADGTHAVDATIKDLSGVSSGDAWSFSYGTPPVLGDPTPGDGSIATTVTPDISLPASDNGPGALAATATVNGADVAATVAGGSVRVAPITFDNGASVDVTVAVSDSAGNRSQKAWGFRIQVYPDMDSSVSDCAGCHAAYEDHPDMGPQCLLCHGGMVDRPHQGRPVDLHTQAQALAFCTTCHVLDITVEHARRKDASGDSLSCVTCHGVSAPPGAATAISQGETSCQACHSVSHAADHEISDKTCAGAGADCHNEADLAAVHASRGCACHESEDSAVISAVQSGDRECVACHDASAVHGGVHAADPNYTALVTGEVSFIYTRLNEGPWHSPMSPATCLSCHRSSNLITLHLGARSCPICHGVDGPRASFTSWDKTCQQAECHVPPARDYTGNLYGNSGSIYKRVAHDYAAATAPHMTEAAISQGSCDANLCHVRGCMPSCHSVKDGTSDTSTPITRASQVASDPIVWRLSPVDSQSGVADTFFSFDGAAFETYGDAEASTGITNELDSVRIGTHTLQYYSVDVAGNREATRTITYTTTGTDTVAPNVALGGLRVSANSVVATSATMYLRDPKVPGPCSGVQSVTISYRSYYRWWNYQWSPEYWYPVTHTFPTSAWDSTSTVLRLEDQARTGFGGGTVSVGSGGNLFIIRYSAVDYAGNRSVQAEDTVYVDTVAPVTTATKVTGVNRWKLTISEYGAGLADTFYSFDGAPFVACTPDDVTNGVANLQPGGESSGSHTLRYYSTDLLGNTETTKTLDYTIP